MSYWILYIFILPTLKVPLNVFRIQTWYFTVAVLKFGTLINIIILFNRSIHIRNGYHRFFFLIFLILHVLCYLKTRTNGAPIIFTVINVFGWPFLAIQIIRSTIALGQLFTNNVHIWHYNNTHTQRLRFTRMVECVVVHSVRIPAYWSILKISMGVDTAVNSAGEELGIKPPKIVVIFYTLLWINYLSYIFYNMLFIQFWNYCFDKK